MGPTTTLCSGNIVSRLGSLCTMSDLSPTKNRSVKFAVIKTEQKSQLIGHASLTRENKAGGSWGQEVHILHVNI